VGGLCILRGCMPSKALLESAHRAEAIRAAGEFGLRAEYFGADGAAIRARKRRLIAEFADHRRQQLESGNFEFIRGEAAFVDSHTVSVRLLDGGQRRLTARAFLIATGSRVKCHGIPGLHDVGFWTSDDLLDADRIPASVVILGGGAIGLEAASYYAGLGSRVSVIQRSGQVLKETDADVAAAITEALEHRGVEIFRGTALVRVERDGGAKCVHFTHAGAPRFILAEEIICALGREPAIEALELARAGVAVERGAIVADARQRCGPEHIFAAGDVCGPFEVVHIAIQQAEVAARNAARLQQRLDGPIEEMDYRLALFAVFTQPQVAAIGLTEREARKIEPGVRVAKHPFADHGKSMIRGETHGFVKLIAAGETCRILGAACVGPEASELIRATARDLARVPHYHPTLSEIWTYTAEELCGEESLSPP